MAQRNVSSKSYTGRTDRVEELAKTGTPEQREAAQRFIDSYEAPRGSYNSAQWKATIKEQLAASKHLREVMGWTRIGNARH